MNAATTAENMINPNNANAVGTAYLSTVSVDMAMFLILQQNGWVRTTQPHLYLVQPNVAAQNKIYCCL